MSQSSGLPEPFHPSPEEQRNYDKSTIKALNRVTGEIDNDHVEDEKPNPQTLDLDQVPTDLYSRPKQQESPSSTKAQHGLGSKRRSRSPSSTQARHSRQTMTTEDEETQGIDPAYAAETIGYAERKFELGDDPRLALTDAIMKLMELQMKIGQLHAEAYDELEECLKRVIRISRRRGSRGRESTG
ncbi:hypothetical protein HII31_12766 [Pseudocercospora fuligena]|uniref:Uncharacterized protein n=1 Tax=Pseudocercospora fuligena TaxID=685502 RepID=A0A8H6VBA3_9PEZI|nr:hypothetical protein HII31_12766 [Pseudocercospora fuligena]